MNKHPQRLLVKIALFTFVSVTQPCCELLGKPSDTFHLLARRWTTLIVRRLKKPFNRCSNMNAIDVGGIGPRRLILRNTTEARQKGYRFLRHWPHAQARQAVRGLPQGRCQTSLGAVRVAALYGNLPGAIRIFCALVAQRTRIHRQVSGRRIRATSHWHKYLLWRVACRRRKEDRARCSSYSCPADSASPSGRRATDGVRRARCSS